MESNPLQQAALHYALGNLNTARTYLNQVQSSPSTLLIEASILITQGKYEEAAQILEGVKEKENVSGALATQLHFLLGKAQFYNAELENAVINMQKAKDSLATNIIDEEERKEFEKQVDLFITKIELELTNSTRVGNINDSAYLQSSKS